MVPIAGVLFVFGYALQRWLINPFISRPEYSQFILLVAVAIILANGAADRVRPGRPQRPDVLRFRQLSCSARLSSTRPRPLPALAAIAVAAALFAFFRFTRLGTAIRACADNYTGAQVIGLNVPRLYALTFGLGAACVGAAGCNACAGYGRDAAARAVYHVACLRHRHRRRAGLDARRFGSAAYLSA